MVPSKEISVDEILPKEEFSNFLNIARSYCTFIETESNLTGIEFLKVTQTHLITLYSFARDLPAVQLHADEDFNSDIDDNVINSLLKFPGDRIPFSYYGVILNPVDMSKLPDTGTGDLLDDLSDIYKDLKHALLVFDTTNLAAKERAIWKFKFDFDYHWGEHCIQALFAIHHYLADNK